MKPTITLFLFFLGLLSVQAQGVQVMHIKGTKIVNGISVTVTHVGQIAILDDMNYCDGETGPYYFGYSYLDYKSKFGSYTFEFDPPVDQIVVNVTGLSGDEGNMEEVKFFINGEHYPIPSRGTVICEDMAVLTNKGNVRPCRGCDVSGWRGTVITGPIESFTVQDSVISGDPAGSLIALYIGNPTEKDSTPYVSKIKYRMDEIEAGKILIVPVTDLANVTMTLYEGENVIEGATEILDNNHLKINARMLKTTTYKLEVLRNGVIENYQIRIQ